MLPTSTILYASLGLNLPGSYLRRTLKMRSSSYQGIRQPLMVGLVRLAPITADIIWSAVGVPHTGSSSTLNTAILGPSLLLFYVYLQRKTGLLLGLVLTLILKHSVCSLALWVPDNVSVLGILPRPHPPHPAASLLAASSAASSPDSLSL